MARKRYDCEYVYVMEAGPSFKIGMAADPALRAKHIGMYRGEFARLIRCWHCPMSARWVEWLAHQRVAGKREYGEWFAGTGTDGVRAVRWAIRQVQAIREIKPKHGVSAATVYHYIKGGKSAVVK